MSPLFGIPCIGNCENKLGSWFVAFAFLYKHAHGEVTDKTVQAVPFERKLYLKFYF